MSTNVTEEQIARLVALVERRRELIRQERGQPAWDGSEATNVADMLGEPLSGGPPEKKALREEAGSLAAQLGTEGMKVAGEEILRKHGQKYLSSLTRLWAGIEGWVV